MCAIKLKFYKFTDIYRITYEDLLRLFEFSLTAQKETYEKNQ